MPTPEKPAPAENEPDVPLSPEDLAERNLKAIAAAYELCESQFDTLYARCQTPDEQQQLRDLLAASREAYWRAVASQLRANNPIVLAIYQDLVRTTQELKELIANLQRVSAAFELLTQTVRLAASLVTLAAI